MIDVNLETSQIMSSQDKYDIISFAVEAADDNGFINSFVFERALLVFAAIVLYPERKDEIAAWAADSPIGAYDRLIEDGTLEEMVANYEDFLEVLTNDAEVWVEEYEDWAHSARGVLDIVQNFSSDIMQTAANRLTQTAQETGVSQLLETAEEWGMGRDALKESTKEPEEKEEDSLFE